MYNLPFIFEECGFGWVPPWIDRELLYNVSYEPASGEIKLYVLDESRSFLHKISRSGTIIRQYEAGAAGVDGTHLERFLGATFDWRDLWIDTVEGDSHYLLIEKTQPSEYIRFLTLFVEACRISRGQFVDAVNRINRRPVGNIFDCCMQRAVSGARVDVGGGGGKIYSRPFRTQNGFEADASTWQFLMRLHDCDMAGLAKPLQHLWVATDLHSPRVVVVTQQEGMLAARD